MGPDVVGGGSVASLGSKSAVIASASAFCRERQSASPAADLDDRTLQGVQTSLDLRVVPAAAAGHLSREGLDAVRALPLDQLEEAAFGALGLGP